MDPELDFVLTTWVWRITGVFCLAVFFWFIPRLVRAVKGKEIKLSIISISAGLFAAALGSGLLLFLMGVDAIVDVLIRMPAFFRLLIGALFMYLSPLPLCRVAVRALQRNCLPEAVRYSSLLMANILVFHPIAYGWLQSLFS